jgi:hypothetical protein
LIQARKKVKKAGKELRLFFASGFHLFFAVFDIHIIEKT